MGAAARETGAAGSRTGWRVLVVDDYADAADSLAELLRLHGHEVLAARSGSEAIGAAAGFAPDIVFLDLGLPGIDGYEVARVLRPNGSRRPLLAAVTGFGSDEDRAKTRAAGFDFHILKPATPTELLALLRDPPPDAA